MDINLENGAILGDVIVYEIAVENKGNVTLSNLELQDQLRDHTSAIAFKLEEQLVANGLIDLSTAYYYSITDGQTSVDSPENIGTVEVGETEIYIARFNVTQAAIDAHILHNSVTATASSPQGTDDVSDVSDNGDNTDGNSVDDITITTLETNPSLEVVKTISAISDSDDNSKDITDPVDLGDKITYNVQVTNTGDTNITDISLVDTLTDSNGDVLATPVPTFSTTSLGKNSQAVYNNTLEIGETAIYTVSYTVDEAGYDSEFLSNTVTATGSTGGLSGNVTDISDGDTDTVDGDGDGDFENDPTVIATSASPSMKVVKTYTLIDNGDQIINEGDIVRYTITVENTGNRLITDITLVDVLTNDNPTDVSSNLDGPYFTSASLGSNNGTLKIDEIATYRAFYTITEDDANSGKLINTVTATGSSPGNTDDVTDVSDDGNEDFDGPDLDTDPTNDPTITNITSDASIKVTKLASVIDDGDNVRGAGDIIKYTITVLNNGIVPVKLAGPNGETTYDDIFIDVLKNGNDVIRNYNNPIILDTTVPAPLGSTESNLIVDDYLTYVAYYTITADDVTSTLISNSLLVYAMTLDNATSIFDVSDDGIDNDLNTIDDPTITELTFEPELEVTKTYSLSGDDNVPDVGETVTYFIAVENTGNVLLTNIELSDVLTDISGNTTLSLNTPPTVTGSTDVNTADGSLSAGEVENYIATYTIEQSAVDLGGIRNTVTVTGRSPNSETNDISDVSDDGDDDDGNTQDDPTDLIIDRTPELTVLKTAEVVEGSSNSITDLGDTINYTITVQNTGNVTLTNVTVVDDLENADGVNLTLTSGPVWFIADNGSSEGTLKVGETATYNASYLIEATGSDSGAIVNTAIVTASSPIGTNDTTASSSVTTQTDEDPSIVVEKTYTIIENGIDGVNPNDIVQYAIKVTNTGNVTLSSINYVDTFTNRESIPQTLTFSSGPFYTGADQGSADGILKPGETATYMALFTLDQAAIDAGGIDNTATFNGTSPAGTVVTDISDDGDTGAGDTGDDVTELIISSSPSIEVVKTAVTTDNNSDNLIGGNDLIEYTITITNTGNVTLTNLTIEDTFTDGDGNALTFDDNNDPQLESSTDSTSNATTLKVGEIKTYSATYTVDEVAASTGSISNHVFAKARSPESSTFDVTDYSDDGDSTTDGDDADDDPTNDPTIVSTSYVSSMEVTKTPVILDNGNGKTGAGDQVTFTITVENTGNTTLTGLTFVDTFTDGDNNALTFNDGTTDLQYSSTDINGSTPGVLDVGETETYLAIYTITVSDEESGKITNSVTATATSPTAESITDVSVIGIPTDGNDEDDPTVILFAPNPELQVEKTDTVTIDSDGQTGNGDTVSYDITITNTGNVTLTNINPIDVLTDGDGNEFSLTLTYVENTGVSNLSSQGTLISGESATYTATFEITQAVEETGFISNVVTVTASSPGNSDDVTAVSDDPDTTEEDDPTITQMYANPSISVLKTASVIDNGDGLTDAGDLIQYTITVENTGNVDLSELTITDTLTDGAGQELTLTNGPFFSGADLGSGLGTLKVGETASYIAYYTISSSAASSGSIHNSAEAKAKSPGSIDFDVIETSDDGDETDDNTTADTYISPNPSIEVVKTYTVSDDNPDGQTGEGDTITYTIVVENTGNVNLTSVGITDTITDGDGNSLTLTSEPTFVGTGTYDGNLASGETVTFTATYLIEQSTSNTGSVINQAEASGTTAQGVTVTDLSDDGDTGEVTQEMIQQ